jgi:hypothetical protein
VAERAFLLLTVTISENLISHSYLVVLSIRSTKVNLDGIKEAISSLSAEDFAALVAWIGSRERRQDLARVPREIFEAGLSALGGEDELWSWLTTPAWEFDNSLPIDLLETHEGRGKVRELLGAIEHGTYW